jgi:hypothetical protein
MFKAIASLVLRELSQKTRCTISLGSVENLDQSQKSDGAGCHKSCRRNVLRNIRRTLRAKVLLVVPS